MAVEGNTALGKALQHETQKYLKHQIKNNFLLQKKVNEVRKNQG
jgi:hypothetical protein